MQSQALPAEYQTLRSEEKLSLLWDQHIVPTSYATLPPIKFTSIFRKFHKLLHPSYLAVSFNHVSDELPEGRERLIHPNGAVAKIEWVPEAGTSVSGIFHTGALGLARLSLAGNPHATRSYIPGIGLKLLIDGRPSVNLQVMHKLTGQGSNQNFFQEEFSNVIPNPPFFMRLFALAFAAVKNPPTELQMHHLGSIRRDGTAVAEKEIVPVYQIIFAPNHRLDSPPDTHNDFRTELSGIPKDSVLYTISIRRTKNADPQKIGTLVSRSAFVSSAYGDEKLFFQHYRK